MAPKDKAEELVRKMCLNDCTIKNIDKAKQCALIAVDEILIADMFMMTEEQEQFWEEVKQEIEKL